jgi:hypothetical protein
MNTHIHIYIIFEVAGIAALWRVTGWTAGGRIPAGTKGFCLLHRVQTDSEAHQASYPMGSGVKWPGREADLFTSI